MAIKQSWACYEVITSRKELAPWSYHLSEWPRFCSAQCDSTPRKRIASWSYHLKERPWYMRDFVTTPRSCMFCNSPHRRDDGGNWRAPACTGSDGRCTRYSVYLDQRLYFPRQYAREKHSKTRDTQSNTWKLQTWQFTISPRLYSHLSAAAILCGDVL